MTSKKLSLYKIKNKSLREKVFTHKSWTNQVEENNEQLEFLGDAVLGLVVADFLRLKHPEAKEGELTKKRSQLVCGANLASLALNLNLDKDLRVESSAYKTNTRILAGVLEAYIGALYLENSFIKVKKMICQLFEEISIEENLICNYKSILQEWCQKKYKTLPLYKLTKQSGLEHKKNFFVSVFINRKHYGTGLSQTKKKAEQDAAKKAVQTLNISVKE